MLLGKNWAVFVDGEPLNVEIKSLSNHDSRDSASSERAHKLYTRVHGLIAHGLECDSCTHCLSRSLEALDRLNSRLIP